ncbi:MAG: hypothetical protein methR_P2034 [Methyloprofundus sp.]|nr:MAG: hypothetical protein methR_P2034 [Methyloprofundus sp.]
MKLFTSLMLSKSFYFLLVYSFAICAQDVSSDLNLQETSWQQGLQKIWRDDIQFHGFLSQGLFSTSGNNVYGHSKDSVSAGLTEVGLNVSYQALNNLSFAVQGLYRRAGESTGDWGDVSLDFAFMDLTFLNFQEGRLGIRGGRVKNPWGLYNETRDVAFTHPTIFLPLTYFDRSRTLFVSMDGGQFYADYNSAIGDFSFKFNYGLMQADDPELLQAIVLNPNVPGHLKSKPSFITQLNYEIMGGAFVFALSYADVNLEYVEQGSFDPYTGLEVNIDAFIFSAQYNGEKFSFASEYSLHWNNTSGIAHIMPDDSPVSEMWYVQAGYRILDNLQVTLRYDSIVQDTNDKKGGTFHANTGLPAHLMFTQDIAVGLRWDITPAWMLRAEYQRVHGASTVSLLDNPDLMGLALDWNIYSLQLAFRF